MRNLQAKCLARIEECITIAEKHFNREFKRIPIQFSNKLTKTGGYFQFSRNWIQQEQGNGAIKIQLSNSILRLNPETFLAEVPGHECAHFIIHEVYGPDEQSHGQRWKGVMQLFGQTANRCHNMKTEQSNQFKYNVNGTEVMVGKIRHNKIQSGRANYSLRGAGKILPSHWVESVASRINTVKPVSNKGSKADIVRANIKRLKGNGYTLAQCLNNTTIINVVAREAGLSKGLCKTYLTNNWSKA